MLFAIEIRGSLFGVDDLLDADDNDLSNNIGEWFNDDDDDDKNNLDDLFSFLSNDDFFVCCSAGCWRHDLIIDGCSFLSGLRLGATIDVVGVVVVCMNVDVNGVVVASSEELVFSGDIDVWCFCCTSTIWMKSL